jgi:tetratricopeptide (TPR) repeat protein
LFSQFYSPRQFAARKSYLRPIAFQLHQRDEQKTWIAKGSGLHDRGNYVEAIANFNKVLAESPDNVLAMHELAFSYFTSKDYGKALETARRGARYKSPLYRDSTP